MPVANFVESVVVYDDVENTSNPIRKHVDWKRSATGLVFEQVDSFRAIITPGNSKSLDSNGYLYDNSTAPSVDFAPVTAKPTWFQFRTAFPSAPGVFGFAGVGAAITLTAQPDGSVVLTGPGLGGNAPEPGAWLYLSGASYGDPGPWSADNQGFWRVTASTSAAIYVRRVYPEDPAGVTETITVAAAEDVQWLQVRMRWVYTEGVLSFAGLKKVLGVTTRWVAVEKGPTFVPLNYPAPLNRLLLTDRYISYVRVESTNNFRISSTDVGLNRNVISVVPAKDGMPGWFESFGFTSYMSVENLGSADIVVNVIYAITQDGV